MTAAPQTAAPVPGQPMVAMVSGADLLAQFNRQAETLARVETKVDGIPAELANHRAQLESQDRRLSKIEQWRAFATGAASLAVLLLTSGVVAALIGVAHR